MERDILGSSVSEAGSNLISQGFFEIFSPRTRVLIPFFLQ